MWSCRGTVRHPPLRRQNPCRTPTTLERRPILLATALQTLQVGAMSMRNKTWRPDESRWRRIGRCGSQLYLKLLSTYLGRWTRNIHISIMRTRLNGTFEPNEGSPTYLNSPKFLSAAEAFLSFSSALDSWPECAFYNSLPLR
ncbi:hypothetical protein K505DRAFT_149077 [Melanomma pulvis-pyrius CBS 109.77]|uniref:Uncharacterized protein n=1 Tax=Melanomma pulvis-pyrius CBS 109.77 TaxID=1314802 RepID=A0A6A6WQM2_9PLEO|nr:hypothetical protein K505DRAFT_149077 [Melanomma pulvis-pyrius CBS 109.77]